MLDKQKRDEKERRKRERLAEIARQERHRLLAQFNGGQATDEARERWARMWGGTYG